jgi:hypothetical protein
VPLVKDMIQSKFLRKEDFDEDRVLTIKGLRLEDMPSDQSREPQQKWVLYFREEAKGMALSVTTIRVLEQAYGSDSDHWIGNRVMIYVDPNVSFGGKVVGGLRLRTPKVRTAKPPVQPQRPAAPARPAQPAPQFEPESAPTEDEFSPQPAADHEFDDPIPF